MTNLEIVNNFLSNYIILEIKELSSENLTKKEISYELELPEIPEEIFNSAIIANYEKLSKDDNLKERTYISNDRDVIESITYSFLEITFDSLVEKILDL